MIFLCHIHRLKRYLSLWLPPLVQMALIFFYSSRPAGSSALERFPLPAGLGHFCGYFLLSLLFYRAFSGGSFKYCRQPAFYAFLAASLYGISDEFHQIFVPGRQASIFDVLIDAAGAATAVAIIWLYRRFKDQADKSRKSLS